MRFVNMTLAEQERELVLTQEQAAEWLASGDADEAGYLAVKIADLRAAIHKRKRAAIRAQQDSGDGYAKLLRFAQQLKADLPLERFIPAYLDIDLRHMGREYAGRCPLGHASDSGLSFRVNSDKGVWKCWGCGNGGDLYVLIGLLNGEDRFAFQVRLLAEMLGLAEVG